MEKLKEIELRSNDVQEILSRPPKWIVRWGITIILAIVIIIVVGSWFFKYPDIISANIVLTTANPPAPVVAKISGKIQNLFVIDHQEVDKHQVLAVIENPAIYEDLNNLIEKTKQFDSGSLLNDDLINFPENLNLGSIQSYYADFLKNMGEYRKFMQMNYHQKKINLLKNEIAHYKKYEANLIVQNDLQLKEYELMVKQFKRDSAMHTQQLMSDSEFEKSKSALLTKQFSYEQSNISITNVQIQIQNIEQSIAELELQEEKQISDKNITIKQSYDNLIAAIESWKYQYVLIAPTKGRVTFNRIWNENQNIKAGETVMTIIPEYEGEIIGKVQLSFQGAGKVKTGQQVNIRFDNYPYMEFGMVKGVVKSISLAPDNNYYTAEINLPNGLNTFYSEKLDFKQEMQGTAEIITEDFRLLQRIIRPLRFTVSKNKNL
ncbi:MAG: HlyD family efflux transporter periplasmic adaptor subunit [Bacteroidales bacterium]|jgi:HlyD family secretion protein|nr:HlyD family efflux transporter periplasmic adaptor subunit [Bacteroidales bacterium]